MGMNTLVLNVGSSSIKFRLYTEQGIFLDGMIDRIGRDAKLVMHGASIDMATPTHEDAGEAILSMAESHGTIGRVIHRIVHGKEYPSPIILTKEILEDLHTLIPLSPLHQKHCLALIHLCQRKTHAEQIGFFDTSFHRTLPDVAKTYPLPIEISTKYEIRRYGFHGIAHQSMMKHACSVLGKTLSSLSIITCQLGSGVSLCMIKNGESVDTTMGFTPLEGIMMGTRSGSLDPAIPLFLCSKGFSTFQVREMLGKKSGLLGVGGSNDVRDLLEREPSHSHARLALSMFVSQVRKQIGAYIAIAGSVDAIVLGGGIIQSVEMRKRLLTDLEHIGIFIDEKDIEKKIPCEIGKGRTRILVCDVDEISEMYNLTNEGIPKKKN